MSKYEPPVMPTVEQARAMVTERVKWADHALANDMYGSAREWQLTILLLRYYIENQERAS